MSKNKFEGGGFDSLMGGLPKKDNKDTVKVDRIEATESSEKEIKATFLVNELLLEKLRAIAYWDRKLIKEILHMGLSSLVNEYEKKNGPINPVPNK